MQVDMSANSGSEQPATAELLCKDGMLDILLTDVFELSTHVFALVRKARCRAFASS